MQNGQSRVRRMAEATEETWLLTKDASGGAGKWSEPGSTELGVQKKSINQEPQRKKNQKAHNTENKSAANSALDKEVILDCQGVFALIYLFGSGIYC